MAGVRFRCFVLSLLAALPAAGAERVLTLDPAASRVTFTVDSTLHEVEGTVRLTSGEIRFDPDRGTAGGRLVVDARSAATGNRARDRKVHQEVLESALFPTIEFAPRVLRGEFRDEGRSRVELDGVLTLHGLEHPMTVTAEAAVHAGRVTAGTRFAVPYLDWGLADPSIFFLRAARLVEVQVTAIGTLSGSPAAPSAAAGSRR